MPSSSARCAQFPRAQDKVHFYIKLRELRDQLKGVARSDEIQELEYSFDLGLAKGKRTCCRQCYNDYSNRNIIDLINIKCTFIMIRYNMTFHFEE